MSIVSPRADRFCCETSFSCDKKEDEKKNHIFQKNTVYYLLVQKSPEHGQWDIKEQYPGECLHIHNEMLLQGGRKSKQNCQRFQMCFSCLEWKSSKIVKEEVKGARRKEFERSHRVMRYVCSCHLLDIFLMPSLASAAVSEYPQNGSWSDCW